MFYDLALEISRSVAHIFCYILGDPRRMSSFVHKMSSHTIINTRDHMGGGGVLKKSVICVSPQSLNKRGEISFVVSQNNGRSFHHQG